VFGEGCAQPLEVAQAQGDGPASGNASRRVREADVALSLLGLEELNQGGEPLLADSLRERQLFDGVGRAPRRCRCLLVLRCRCRHESQRTRRSVRRVPRMCVGSVQSGGDVECREDSAAERTRPTTAWLVGMTSLGHHQCAPPAAPTGRRTAWSSQRVEGAVILSFGGSHSLFCLAGPWIGRSRTKGIACDIRENRGTSPFTDPHPDELRRLGAGLALDALATQVTAALADAGIRVILLKGPALADWLYGDEARPYSDVDLLIAAADRATSELVLEDMGFEVVALDILPHDRPHHARTWVRRGGAAVDLHHTLIGIGASSEFAWSALTQETERMQLAGAEVEVLSRPARAFMVTLHAAQHGALAAGPVEDLKRAIEHLPFEQWESATRLAERLDALPAFVTGLSLTPGGRHMAMRLHLPEHTSVESVLRSWNEPNMALGFAWLSETKGLRRKLMLVVRKIVPQPEFLRAWSPLARRGRVGLAAAYAWRPLWLLLNAGPGYVAWRKARKVARRRPKN
jgi:Uncharacterised nucleotidyltransferase